MRCSPSFHRQKLMWRWLGDDSAVRAVGRGTITFQRESMSPMVLRDVLYVPGLKNLISVSMIEDRGLGVSILDGHVRVFPKTAGPSASYSIGVICGKLYKLLFQPQHALAHSSGSELCDLWHRRMAHLHHPALGLLRHMVTGLPQFSSEQSDVCRGCALGEHTKTAFPSSDSRSARILDLIHSNLCGPMSSVSLRGYEYYVTFIDDHSKKTWIYFLKRKKSEEVLQRFQEFKSLVENQIGRKIRVLRSDNRGEYTSKEFDGFCR